MEKEFSDKRHAIGGEVHLRPATVGGEVHLRLAIGVPAASMLDLECSHVATYPLPETELGM